MSMNRVTGLAAAFFVMLILGYMAIGAISTVPEPESGTEAREHYDSLSSYIELLFTGYYGVLMLLVLALMIAALIMLKFAF